MEKLSWNEVRLALMTELNESKEMRDDYLKFKTKVTVIGGFFAFISSVTFIAVITALVQKILNGGF